MRARLKTSKWALTPHRFYELYHLCLQYPEWVAEYGRILGTRGINYGSSTPQGPGHPTERDGIRRAYLRSRIDLIEQTAQEADDQLYRYILKAVTMDGVTYKYLMMHDGIPCSAGTFYDRRRKFYWLLDQKLSNNFDNQGTNTEL